MENKLNHELADKIRYIKSLEISEGRIETLNQVIGCIGLFYEKNKTLNLNFICTHNSRRSQLCQIWATVWAYVYHLNHISCFSGGTEVTGFHPNAVNALISSGFTIKKGEQINNPEYIVQFSSDHQPVLCYSKIFDDPAIHNPFIAIMTCSDAEENCPFIPNALSRIALKYKDPKYADGTPEQDSAYLFCSDTIASELNYIFSGLSRN